MTNRNSHSECLQYSPYLYDYLCNNRDDIPESALTHITQCAQCAAEIDVLETELKACDASTDNVKEAARLANLELHFAYIGKEVGCSEVKSFLASMASDSFPMRIPTPITVHVDNCSACSKDMKAIRDMALPENQLFKVGCVLAGFASQALDDTEVGSKIVDAMAGVECERSQIDRLAMIVKRPESGIRTCYSVKDENTGQAGHADGQVYEDWQIDVKVLHGNEKCRANAQSSTKKLRLQRFAKPFAVAAAVLVVAFIMFNGPVASAGLDQIYKALEQVKNVYLKTISVIDGNVTQEIWVSRNLNIKIGRNEGKVFLWDIGNERLVTRQDNSSTASTSTMDADLLSHIKRTMEVPWSLLPFNNMSDLLAVGAEWQLLTGTGAEDITSEIEVYEVLWTETLSTGNITSWKWRGFVDSETSLPKRVERWEKYTGDNEYHLVTAIEVSYPDTEQIQTIMDEILR